MTDDIGTYKKPRPEGVLLRALMFLCSAAIRHSLLLSAESASTFGVA